MPDGLTQGVDYATCVSMQGKKQKKNNKRQWRYGSNTMSNTRPRKPRIQHIESILKLKERIQFARRVRTVYINGRTLSNLRGLVQTMIDNNQAELRLGSDRIYTYTLGSIIYLIDIRNNTYFKSGATSKDLEQHFEPSHLKELFETEHIRYRYCQSLGNPKEFRKHCEGDPDKNKELYLNHIRNDPEARKTFNQLFDIVNNNIPKFQICLLCYCEPKKEACHRFWLREALIHKYYEINNIENPPVLSHYWRIDNKINF